jgi:hypothetical protein
MPRDEDNHPPSLRDTHCIRMAYLTGRAAFQLESAGLRKLAVHVATQMPGGMGQQNGATPPVLELLCR